MNDMAAREPGPPSWIRPEIQQKIEWRDQDIVISVPPKSGTTWTMNIVHQLLTGGDADFENIYQSVPWIEFMNHPDQPEQEILERLSEMPFTQPRAFKTHSAPPDIPYLDASSGKKVRYIVVGRNPEEALVSIKPFFEKHTDAWYDLWDIPIGAMRKDSFPEFYYEVLNDAGFNAMLFGFLAAWWPLRFEPNVLFMHFADMKRDHNGALNKIASFLEIEPTESQWHAIQEYTSFNWMKQHDDKFSSIGDLEVPILETGAMIRKGQVGSAKEDGMNEEISKHIYAIGKEICSDPDALTWFYKGGDISRQSC